LSGVEEGTALDNVMICQIIKNQLDLYGNLAAYNTLAYNYKITKLKNGFCDTKSNSYILVQYFKQKLVYQELNSVGGYPDQHALEETRVRNH